MEATSSDLNLAVLIDADNAPRTALKEIMAEVAVYGNPTIKRIYGDWTAPNMESWKPLLLEHAISPVQQYSYTTGKNSTDCAMIIDAMDILYGGHCGGFVLVSSDSDFTRLATRLRETGMKVYGMGERKTPQSFIVACDKFVYIEVIRSGARSQAEQVVPVAKRNQQRRRLAGQEQSHNTIPEEIVELLLESVEDLADEDGYAYLGDVGNLLLKKQPDFDARNFGFSKLSKLIYFLDDEFDVDERCTPGNPSTQVYLRERRK